MYHGYLLDAAVHISEMTAGSEALKKVIPK
jgi:hypothetical protein